MAMRLQLCGNCARHFMTRHAGVTCSTCNGGFKAKARRKALGRFYHLLPLLRSAVDEARAN